MVDAAGRGLPPVAAFAALGAVCLGFVIYLAVAWIASGDATPTPTGPDPVPAWMHGVGIAVQVINPLVALSALGWLVVRPLAKRRRIPFDGLLILATATTYWQDPLVNYAVPFASYNADMVNLGSWAMHIPGWQSPNGNLFPEPLLFAFPVFVLVFLSGAAFANSVMRRVESRWPHTGVVGLVGVAFVAIMALSIVVEPLFVRLGLYHYGGAPGPMIAGGSYQQFPLLEIPLMAVYWTLVACLRYFRDDRGLSLAERGAERLRVRGRRRTLVRWLALVGVLNAGFLGLYNMPSQFVALNSAAWVDDVQSRSYFTGGICGPGTSYACPGPATPIPRRDSSHVSPEGKLVPGALPQRSEP